MPNLIDQVDHILFDCRAALVFLLIFFAGCEPDPKSSASIIFSYHSQVHDIASLPFKIQSITFYGQDGSSETLNTSQRQLDLGYRQQAFIEAFKLQPMTIERIRIHLYVNGAGAMVFDEAEKRWKSAQLIDHSEQFVPDSRQDFVIDKTLSKPLTVKQDLTHFLSMSVLKESLTPYEQFESIYMMLDPAVDFQWVNETPVVGLLNSVTDQQAVLQLPIQALQINWSDKKGGYELDTHLKEFVALNVQFDEKATLIANPQSIKPLPYQSGFVLPSQTVGKSSFLSHTLDHLTGLHFNLHEDFFQDNTLFSEGQNIAVLKGQSEDDYLQLPSLVEGVSALEHSDGFKVERINGLPITSFFPEEKLELNQLEPEISHVGRYTFSGQLLKGAFLNPLLVSFENDVILDRLIDSNEDVLVMMDKQQSSLSFLESFHQSPQLEGVDTQGEGFINDLVMSPDTQILMTIHAKGGKVVFPVRATSNFYALFQDAIASKKMTRLSGRGHVASNAFELEKLTFSFSEYNEKQRSSYQDAAVDISQLNVIDSQRMGSEKRKFMFSNLMSQKVAKPYKRAKRSGLSTQRNNEITQGITTYDNLSKLIQSSINKTPVKQRQFETNRGIYHADRDEKRGISSTYRASSYRFIKQPDDKQHLLLFSEGLNQTHIDFKKRYPSFDNKLGLALASLAKNQDGVGQAPLIQFGQGRYYFDTDQKVLLPIVFDLRRGEFQEQSLNVASIFVQEQAYKGYRLTLHKLATQPNSIYMATLMPSAPDRSRAIEMYIEGNADGEVMTSIKQFIDVTPAHKMQRIYFGSENGQSMQGLLDNALSSGRQAKVADVRFRQFKPYRLDLVAEHQVGVGPDKVPFHYMPDQILDEIIEKNEALGNSFFNRLISTSYVARLNALNAGRKEGDVKELRVLIQLENDEGVINADIYQAYMRYPDHSILVHMNNNGDFSIVNGIKNIDKFTDPAFKDNVIYTLHGHGNRFFQGTKVPETLAKNVLSFTKLAPSVLKKRYKEWFPKKNISSKAFHIKPSSFVMDGCSLGKRGKWFAHSLTDKFSKHYVEFGSDQGDSISVDVSNSGVSSKDLLFYGASFTEKFIYSYNKKRKKLPVIFEAWAEDSIIDTYGESSAGSSSEELLAKMKRNHKVFWAGSDGLPEQIEGVQYRMNSAGFVEYQLPEWVEPGATRSYRKVFRGPTDPANGTFRRSAFDL